MRVFKINPRELRGESAGVAEGATLQQPCQAVALAPYAPAGVGRALASANLVRSGRKQPQRNCGGSAGSFFVRLTADAALAIFCDTPFDKRGLCA